MPWGVLGGFNRLSNILAGLEVVKVLEGWGNYLIMLRLKFNTVIT